MKPSAFALNPNAASYIPISKREGYVGGDESVWSMSSTHLTQNQHNVASLLSPEVSMGKNPSAEDPHGSFSTNTGQMTYTQMRDEDPEMDMDIEYLQMTFPGLSQESITDVYLANNGDVEATIDMLCQLEIYSGESPENLPGTLDIGNACEPGPSTSKQKNDSIETVAASSPLD